MILKKTIVKSEKDHEIINYYSPNNDSEKWESNVQKFNSLERLYQELIINIGIEIDDIVNKHAISEDELIEISKVVAEYVTYTRLTDFRKILFDGDRPKLLCEFRKMNEFKGEKFMDYQEMWNKLKNDLSIAIDNLTDMSEQYNKKYESTKVRVTNRKCKEYKNIYKIMVELESK